MMMVTRQEAMRFVAQEETSGTSLVGPVVKILHYKSKGYRFDSQLENLRSHMLCSLKKKKFN